MSWTIKDLLAIPTSDAAIEEPVEGTVKVCKPVEEGQYGQSQWFIISDGTGEIAVTWRPPKKELPIANPVQEGDTVRIQAELYNRKWTGAKKETYQGKDKQGNPVKKSKIVVYGPKLKNLTRSAAPAQTTPPIIPSSAARGLPPLAPPTMTEIEAVDLWKRVYERALEFCEGPDPARCASTVLSGAMAGMLRLDSAPAKTSATSSDFRDEDDVPPFDDSDIPDF